MHRKTQQTALVTGATGFVGPHLINCLLKCGYRVRGFDRQWPSSVKFSDDIEIYEGDLSDRLALEKAVEGIEVIFHLAAKLHINNPSQTSKAEYEQVNVEGTRRLVEAVRKTHVARLVFFSTINVYGASEKDTVHNENSPLHPDSFYSQTKAQAEKLVLLESPSVVLRLAAVYGPRMKGNYPRLVNALRRGRFIMIGNGQNRRTLVHVHDVCQAAILAAEHPAAVGRVYNVTDGHIHTLREIIEAICAALGKPPPVLKLPIGLIRPVLGLLEDGGCLFGKQPPLGRSLIDKFTEDIAVSSDRIQQELDFRPQYDLLTGWQETIQQMGI